MSQDEELDEGQLPKGQTPIWIKAPPKTSDVKMLERVLKVPELNGYEDNVTVLYQNDKKEKLLKMCNEYGLKCLDCNNVTGIEDEVIILLNTNNITPEYITRGIKMLVIITNSGKFSK